MSAESPSKASHKGGHVVAPRPVSDRSIIENVAGFINEVVPQGYSGAPVAETKESISWARFEYADVNDLSLYPDTFEDGIGTPPLLLVVGYGCGVQVWAVPASGEAREVLSWRQGVVRTLRILPSPHANGPVPDNFAQSRPLVVLCDSSSPGPQFCSLSFISLRTGEQVKNIKFKNPVCDVLATRRSVVVTFLERIAVFDASTLEDRLTITTCYPCPGPNPNPVTLGTRWLAYAERKLLLSKQSSGGSDGEGVQSYTATVIHAAKSFGKGLRELGESVASSLTGTSAQKGMFNSTGAATSQQPATALPVSNDHSQAGIVSIIDVEADGCRRDSMKSDNGIPKCNMIAHFTAHSDPIFALAFDPSGMLLVTADKRGHDFHVFRIHPHPGGSSLTAVHHLYILHRGDTTAKVQDIAFSIDSRWVAISTLRGTTHVFPITPYGGPVGIRTHTTPHIVNRLSRFHRSAGLTADGRNSPVPAASANTEVLQTSAMPYSNPWLPPYPHPTLTHPVAQIHHPQSHAFRSSSTQSSSPVSQYIYNRNPSFRSLGKMQSLSEEGLSAGGTPLKVTVSFAPPRAWLVGSPTVARESCAKARKRVIDSLFVMSCHGNLIEYDLFPKPLSGIPKEKVCDDTQIELEVIGKAQWSLLRPPRLSDLQPPLAMSNPLMSLPDHLLSATEHKQEMTEEEKWVSQVEIITHAGPHRRLWMGPQFTFKTYSVSGSTTNVSLEDECVDIGPASTSRPARSTPISMPVVGSSRPVVPVFIESGYSNEQPPVLSDNYTEGDGLGESICFTSGRELQLKEDLADAMMESPKMLSHDGGRRVFITRQSSRADKKTLNAITKAVNPEGSVLSIPIEEILMPGYIHEDMEDNIQGCITFPATVKGGSVCSDTKFSECRNTVINTCERTNEAILDYVTKKTSGKIDKSSNNTNTKSLDRSGKCKTKEKTSVGSNNGKDNIGMEEKKIHAMSDDGSSNVSCKSDLYDTPQSDNRETYRQQLKEEDHLKSMSRSTNLKDLRKGPKKKEIKNSIQGNVSEAPLHSNILNVNLVSNTKDDFIFPVVTDKKTESVQCFESKYETKTPLPKQKAEKKSKNGKSKSQVLTEVTNITAQSPAETAIKIENIPVPLRIEHKISSENLFTEVISNDVIKTSAEQNESVQIQSGITKNSDPPTLPHNSNAQSSSSELSKLVSLFQESDKSQFEPEICGRKYLENLKKSPARSWSNIVSGKLQNPDVHTISPIVESDASVNKQLLTKDDCPATLLPLDKYVYEDDDNILKSNSVSLYDSTLLSIRKCSVAETDDAMLCESAVVMNEGQNVHAEVTDDIECSPDVNENSSSKTVSDNQNFDQSMRKSKKQKKKKVNSKLN